MRTILNLGCGKDVYGTHFVDAFPQRSDVLRWKEGEKLPFKSNYFNEVYCKNLFEHLTQPLAVLQEARRVLKKGGKIILVTDNAGFWLYHNTKGARIHLGGYEENPEGGKDDKHYALFTPSHLLNWLAKAGFKEAKAVYTTKSWELSLPLKFLCYLLAKTRFAPMAFAQIRMEALK